MKIKTFYLLIPIGLFLLSAFSPICAEEKKIPLRQSEKELLEQSRIEIPSHYIKAHDFEGEMANGGKASLADFNGKFLILNFWATWCAPCRTEIPLLIAMQARHAHDIQIVGIAVDDAESVRRFEDEVGLNYVSLIGLTEGPELMQRYGSAGQLPFTLVFDQTGVLRYRKTGELQAAELSDWLTRLL